jgi:hypothetical protein
MPLRCKLPLLHTLYRVVPSPAEAWGPGLNFDACHLITTLYAN